MSVSLSISVAWNLEECEKIVNAYCKKGIRQVGKSYQKKSKQ